MRKRKSPESKANTPMLEQYFQIKEENPGAIVMFRLGDFYEFFGEDAKIASRELDIVLTGRAAGNDERMPMCGVPHHALDQYLTRLVQKGYRIAICEQLEDPKLVKGIVKRGVVRIVTPGTAMEIATQEHSSNYLTAILQGEVNCWAMAVCEMSTGELRINQFQGIDALEELSAEMIRLKPCEILLSENDYLVLDELINQWLEDNTNKSAITIRSAEMFSHQNSLKILPKQFPDMASNRPLWLDFPLAGDCAGAILEYLRETQKSNPLQISQLELDFQNQYLIMDSTTFRNLEITRNLRSFEKKGSLFDLLDDTQTATGSRLLKEWVERPLRDKESIKNRLDAVEILVNSWSLRQEMRRDLKDIYDMERLMTRVIYGRAVPRELLALKQSFGVLPKLKQSIRSLDKTEEFENILTDLDILEDLYDLLDSSLIEDIPLNWKDGGFIKKGYNSQADEYRIGAINGRQWMMELENKEKEKTGIKSLKIGFNKVFGYYFEVTKSNLAQVPEYFQRKQTLTSGERYVTDELISLEGLVLGAEEKMLFLEMTLYQEILQIIGRALTRVQRTSRALAKIDVYQALAETAVRNHYCRPTILSPGCKDISFKDLRHPVVEKIMDKHHYVPNDLYMNNKTNLYIITGPNMGGKSTYCRSVAIAFIMAQMGSFIPASEARIALRDRVFARVGASDDLRGGQSTFMMEMTEVAHILKYATAESLVILDEVGRGTGTYDGISVAWAVSEYIVNQLNAKTLFATHYLELTRMAKNIDAIKNLSLVVEEEGDRIVFLHKILPGSANKSYGIHVAKLAGLPETVINKAKSMLSYLEKDRETEETVNKTDNQLQLFTDINQQVNHHDQNLFNEELAKKYHTLIEELQNKELSQMTPIEALNYLFKLQTLIKE